MSTLSGLTPTSVTPSIAPVNDPDQQAQLRRRNETAVFSPVEESEATTASQNRPEQGAAQQRQASAQGANPASASASQQRNDSAEASRPVQQNTSEDDSSQSQNLAERRNEERLQKEQLETIRDLARRDREVRSHEQAHQTVGGQYAGAMKLDYTTGPDGRRYAVSGEVPIDLSPVPGNPEATRLKAQQIRQAALAPAEPSSQDRSVAAQATQLALQAQVELRQQERAETEDSDREVEESRSIEQESENRTERSDARNDDVKEQEFDNAQERFETIFEQSRDVNEQALVREQYKDQQATVGRNLDFIV
ncbi:hypothetical protein BGP77_15635 [Saccharospirillum sp. MSK14-1]|uniref:putative metalloprotease CJM1_0395 family protein n=1 Tax=Saccharospirillum sp. MSK14-1 TaxID=1897632 RepID=UPI000D35ADD3|nr:putative metalloprotease CJM1_0395 family protein [Saccharospirillum sp. MSK14-1]PTY37896.1 hypothetical protein BGP77_15635 [Saccharospirillum sp. MSK14-1]